jgi:drug/metabolite transporter (DMT)-like permease
MRSSSPSISPRARWSGCWATVVRWSSVSREADGESVSFAALVSRRYLVMLIALAAIWGSSFMFIKVAVRHVEPATLVFGRLVFAVATLAVLLPFRLAPRALLRAVGAAFWPLVAMAILNGSVPFWLLSWGETRIGSGLAALIQAATPLFTAVFAFWFVHTERVSGLRLVGVLIGFVGVALLVGVTPSGSLLAAIAVLASAASYAGAALCGSWRLGTTSPLVIAFGTSALAALISAPAGLAQLPGRWPGWEAVGSIAVLGVLGLGVGYILYFGIITGAGAARAVLVTYLVPPMALVYGAAILGESIGVSDVAGLALILGGVALGTGNVRVRAWAKARP